MQIVCSQFSMFDVEEHIMRHYEASELPSVARFAQELLRRKKISNKLIPNGLSQLTKMQNAIEGTQRTTVAPVIPVFFT